MENLLEQYSIGTIVLVFFGVVFFIKEVCELVDYFRKKINNGYDDKIIKKEQVQFFTESLEELKQESSRTTQEIKEIKAEFDNVNSKINLLTESDKDDIKGWIVSQYHFFMEQGWIDDFSMDTIEKRYGHYVEEGGNHYVHTLMKELKALPKDKGKAQK